MHAVCCVLSAPSIPMDGTHVYRNGISDDPCVNLKGVQNRHILLAYRDGHWWFFFSYVHFLKKLVLAWKLIIYIVILTWKQVNLGIWTVSMSAE